MRKIIVAGIQIACSPNQVQKNTEKAIAWLEKAVKETSCQLVVFPETITTGFVPNMPKNELWKNVETIPGSITDTIGEVAKKHGIYVVWPTYERGENENIVYNSSACASE